MEKIKAQMKKFVTLDEFGLLRGRVDQLETMVSSLRKAMGDLEKKIKNMNKQGGGADQDAVNELNDALQKLRSEFESYKTSTDKRIDALEN